jgi:hypothetical protein
MARRLLTTVLLAGIFGLLLGCGDSDSKNPTIKSTGGKQLPTLEKKTPSGGGPGGVAPKPE